MAENIRNGDPPGSGVDAIRLALISVCHDEEENCLYTSATFYIWLRWLKSFRALLWAIGGVASLVAASHILEGGSDGRIAAAGAALAGVVLPALVRLLRLDAAIRNYGNAAAKLKDLQHEFGLLADVWSLKEFPEFEREARKTLIAMSDARKQSLTPPELCFKLARRKIKSGNYVPDRRAT